MAMEYTNGLIIHLMKALIKTIKNMDLVNLYLLTERSLRDNGLMEKDREKEW